MTAAITRLALAATVMMINVWSGIIFFMDDGADRTAVTAVFYGGLLIGVRLFAVAMAETVAIRASRQRRPMLILLDFPIAAEAALGLAFLA